MKTTKKQLGFTLIEVLVAMTVLSVGILSLVRVFPFALQISKFAAQKTVAVNLAQAKIEEMFYLDYDNITVGTVETRHRLSADVENPFYKFERETSAEHIDSNLNTSVSETGLKKITTTIYWNSPIFSAEKNSEIVIVIGEK